MNDSLRASDLSLDLAKAAADLAADRKAADIAFLHLESVSSVAEYFVVCHGRSHVQVEAICERIVSGIKQRFEQIPLSVEGLDNAQWAIIDYGAVVVHVFQEATRGHYDLERLWNHAPRWNYEDPSDKGSAQA